MRAELEEVVTVLLSAMDSSEKRIMLTINERVGNIEERLLPLERDMYIVKETLLDMREDLDAGLKAIDSHALKLMGHDTRIKRLEKRFA